MGRCECRLSTLLIAILAMLLGVQGLRGETAVPARLVSVRDFEANLRLSIQESTARGTRVVLENRNPEDVIPDGPVNFSRLVAVPQSAGIRCELLDADWRELSVTNELGPLRLGLYDDTGERGFPIASAEPRLIFLDQFRTVGAASLAIQPLISGRAATPGQTPVAERVLLRRAVFLIHHASEDLIPAFSSAEEFQRYDPYLAEHTADFFLNPESVWKLAKPYGASEASDAAMEWLRTLEVASRENPILRIQVSRPGIYSIGTEDLLKVGINPERFPIEWLRVLLDGEELPIHTQGRGQGGMAADTRLVVAVPDRNWERTPYKTLFLMTQRSGLPPKRDLTIRAKEPKDEPPVILDRRVEIFRPTKYDHMLPLCGPTLRWESATIAPGREEAFEFFAGMPDPETSATLRVHFSGRWGADSYGYELEVNGLTVGAGTFNGTNCHEAVLDLPPGTLLEGGNMLVVRGAPGDRPANTAPISFMMATIQYVSPPQGLRAQEWAQLRFPADAPAASIEFHSTAGRDVAGMIAVEAKDGTVRLQDIPEQRVARSRNRAYRTVLSAEEQPVRVAFTPRGSLLRPDRISRVLPQTFFRDKDPVDYLIITHPMHRDAIMPHAEYRAREGRRVAVVTTDEVYDTFAFGQKSYRAIHQAIRHTLTQRTEGHLSHVLLVGEGSEWWRDFRPTPNVPVQPNDLPVFGWADSKVRIRGDDNYARVAGNGELADLEIGRFSVTTPEELAPVIEKIQAYESAPPPGAWMSRHVFVTDDEPDFIALAEETIRNEFTPGARIIRIFQHDEPYENYFRVAYRKRSVATTQRILHWLNRGVQTMAYIGHGGPNLWSGERILHNRDLLGVDHGMRQPIIISASCDTSWVDYPTPPVSTSLGENFLRGRENGAAAVWAPVAGTSATEHRVMLFTFYRGMFRHELDRLGTITLYSKLQFMAERRQGYVPEQFLLLGDPALRIPRVKETLDARIEPETILATTGGEFRVSGTVPGMAWGALEIDVQGAERRSEIPHAHGRVRLGAFSETLTLPPFLAPGRYEVIVTAEHEGTKLSQSRTLFLEVRAPDLSIQWGDAEPQVARGPEGAESIITLRIENHDTVAVSNVHLILRDRSLAAPVLNVPLAMEPGQVIEEPVTLVLPAGVRPIDAIIVPSAQANAPRPHRIVERTLFLRGTPKDESPQIVSVPPDMLRARRDSQGNRTRIEWPIYNLTAAPLHELAVSLFWRRGNEMLPIGGPQVLTIPPGEEPVWAAAEIEGLLPAEWLPFRMTAQQTGGRGAAQTLDFSSRVPVGPNMRVVPATIRVEKPSHLQGETVFISAEIENNGDTIIENYETQLWVYQPWVRDSLATPFAQSFFVQQKEPIYPGERRSVRTRWDPPATQPSVVPLVLTVRAEQESDLSDNAATVEVHWAALPNLAVTEDRIRVSHRLVLEGDEVAVSVPVFNTSPQDFRYPFIVTVDALHLDGGTRRVHTETLPPMRARSQTMLQFRWRVAAGEHRLHINANADREYGEASPRDNEVTLNFDVLLAAASVGRDPQDWNSETLRPWTTLWNLRRGPQETIEFVGRDMREGRELRLEQEYFVDAVPPPPGAENAADSRYSFDRGAISISEQETASPLRMRVPLWDSGTMIYDVYVNQRGRLPNDPYPSGSFRYRLEQQQWSEVTEATSGFVHLGRVNSRDNILDLEISTPETPSRNEFTGWRVVPVKGSIQGPVILTEEFPTGTAKVDGDFPGETSAMVFVRYGYGAREDVQWSAWGGIAPGRRVPTPAPGARYFQWRVDLFGDGTETPSFRSMEWVPMKKK